MPATYEAPVYYPEKYHGRKTMTLRLWKEELLADEIKGSESLSYGLFRRRLSHKLPAELGEFLPSYIIDFRIFRVDLFHGL